jgi:hypothetical protein
VPVRAQTWEWEEPLRDRAPSFTDVVALWVRALEEGWYRFDSTTGAWVCDDWNAIPLNLRQSGLLG